MLNNDGANATLKVGSATSTLTGLAQPAGTSRNVEVGAPFSQSTEIASRVRSACDSVTRPVNDRIGACAPSLPGTTTA